MIPALLRTRSAAEELLRKAASHMPTVPKAPCLVALAALALPSPHPLVAELVALGVDKSSATRISSIYLQCASRLKTICESDYHRRRQSSEIRSHFSQDAKSASLMPSAYLAIYTQRLSSWRSYLVDDVTPRVLAAQIRRQVDGAFRPEASPPSKRPFNQDAIPVLEQFFDTNAFPSRLEKYELATRCDMEYKQIHVWFQNRRSRFRKEGKALKKGGDGNGILRQLEDCVVDLLLPKHGDPDDGSVESTDIDPTTDVPRVILRTRDVLDHQAPAHAFPSPYPPVCPYDPFPVAQGKQQPFELPWLRNSVPQSRPAGRVVDVTDLVTAFSRLSVGDHIPRPQYRRTHSHSSNCDPLQYSFGFATPCSRAPHPALIRKLRRPSRAPCQQSCSSSRTRATHLIPKGMEGSTPALAPIGSSALPRAKRTLPRRMPKHPPIPHSTRSPPRVEHIPLSRVSSISSSSSSSSDLDAPLRTPSPAAAELPLTFTLLSPVHPFSEFGDVFDYVKTSWPTEKVLPSGTSRDIPVSIGNLSDLTSIGNLS